MNTDNLEKNISINFKNKDLLKNIFVHRSYLNEHKRSSLESNEKLEFLGDSVLSLITSIYLYRNYPELKEGDYTDIKASIVRTESLAKAAAEQNLGQYLLLSKGEESGDGRNNKNILADCFEALVAGIFLEKDFDKAYDFVVDKLFKKTLGKIIKDKLYLSPKSRLQEIIQSKYKILPDYKILKEKGPEHKKSFFVGVYVNSKKLGEGEGASKKYAEEEAAKNALEEIIG